MKTPIEALQYEIKLLTSFIQLLEKELSNNTSNPKVHPALIKAKEYITKHELAIFILNAQNVPPLDLNKSSDLVDVDPPIGDFILKNATGELRADGTYYHYSEVCMLLNHYRIYLKINQQV